jgi:hypothetical protein
MTQVIKSSGIATGQPLSVTPPEAWQEGQIVGKRYPLALDPAIVSGDYRLRLSLVADGSIAGQSVEIETVTVVSGPRTHDLPSLEHALNMKLGQEIALRGYSLDRPRGDGNALRLTLYWQALKRVTGQRLPVWDEAQQPVPDAAIPLEWVSSL